MRGVKISKRMNTIYFKLIISFFTLLLITTVFTGTIAYVGFSNSYFSELDEVNNAALDNMKRNIENLFFKKMSDIITGITYDNVANEDLLFFFSNSIDGNHHRLVTARKKLIQTLTANADIVNDICFFYERNRTALSARSGISYLADSLEHKYYNTSWLIQMKDSTADALWLDNKDYITYVRSYPYSLAKTSSGKKGYVAISIKKDVLKLFINDLTPQGYEAISLIDVQNNKDIFSLSQKYDYDGIPPELIESIKIEYDNHINNDAVIQKESVYTGNKRWSNQILEFGNIMSKFSNKTPTQKQELKQGTNYGRFMCNFENNQAMLSFNPMESNNWLLVSIISLSTYYSKATGIRNSLFLSCGIIIILGTAIAYFFATKIYDPLKILIEKTKMTMSIHEIDKIERSNNECILIDTVIDSLSLKVNSLENTIINNRPIILRNFIFGLINKTIKYETEYSQYLEFLNIQSGNDKHMAIIVELDKYDVLKMTIENRQYLKYSIISHIENNQKLSKHCMATELSDHQTLVTVHLPGTTNEDYGIIRNIVNDLDDFITSKLNIPYLISVGEIKSNLFNISHSYFEAKTAVKYRYLLPGLRIIFYSAINDRENSNKKINDSMIEEFTNNLNMRNFNKTSVFIDKLTDLMIKGPYPAEHCGFVMKEIVSAYMDYLKNMNVTTKEISDTDLFEEFTGLKNIYSYNKWLKELVDRAYSVISEKENSVISATIIEIKNYITNNIEKDLTLVDIAKKYFYSSQYLSKIFKEETGKNLVDFISEQRLNKAKDLITITDETIEQISKRTGFNSTTYFIRQFKKRYGVTPGNYRYQSNINK